MDFTILKTDDFSPTFRNSPPIQIQSLNTTFSLKRSHNKNFRHLLWFRVCFTLTRNKISIYIGIQLNVGTSLTACHMIMTKKQLSYQLKFSNLTYQFFSLPNGLKSIDNNSSKDTGSLFVSFSAGLVVGSLLLNKNIGC